VTGKTSSQDAAKDRENRGWNLEAALQQQFIEHQPNMMFSEGSSTIPDTTWTQKVALGHELAAVVQSPVHVNAQESQKSKSSLGWSEFAETQGVWICARHLFPILI
jgi:hypothetical protein